MSFDRIAPHYRWLETVAFGAVLQKARTRWIEEISAPRRVLIVGQGVGCFLGEFLRVHPRAVVDCVDTSARMLELARRRVHDSVNRVRFFQRDILSWTPSASYDLLVTNFVLDCFPQDELRVIVRKLAESATPGAHLLLADFSLPEIPIARAHAKIWLAAMYWFFRATTEMRAKHLIDPTPELEAHGFVCFSRSFWRLGLVKSELWQNARPEPSREDVRCA